MQPKLIKNVFTSFRLFWSIIDEILDYEMILVEKKDKVAVVTLNRPKALNALCEQLLKELSAALNSLQKDNSVSSIVLTGSKKAFAGILFRKLKISFWKAGADIKEMAPKTFMDVYNNGLFQEFTESFKQVSKPVIAAVNGYALGGNWESSKSFWSFRWMRTRYDVWYHYRWWKRQVWTTWNHNRNHSR